MARVIFLKDAPLANSVFREMRPVRREKQIKKEPALALRDLGRILDLHGVPGGTPSSIFDLFGVPAKKNHATLRVRGSPKCYTRLTFYPRIRLTWPAVLH